MDFLEYFIIHRCIDLIRKDMLMQNETIEGIDYQIMQLKLFLLVMGGRKLEAQHDAKMKLKKLYAQKRALLEEQKSQTVRITR